MKDFYEHDDQMQKQPKWVQAEFNALRSAYENCLKELESLRGERETNIFYVVGSQARKPLPGDCEIIFQAGKFSHMRPVLREGVLRIYGVFKIVVEPIASNTVDIKMDPS